MAGRYRLVSAVVASVALIQILVSIASAHICLMDPAQRGGFNVSDPGDISCYQPTGPCGIVPPANPQVVLEGGTGYPIFFQQNLNHYNPGWPGFLDVAWAQGAKPQSSDFKTLATIPDYWPHLQAQQTNFSVVVQIPNIDCDHCTLRVRYHPNKPTEPIFHNCADIKIVKSSPPSNFGRLFGLAQYGKNGDSYLVEIGLDGQLIKQTGPMPVHLSANPELSLTGFANGLVAIDTKRQQLYFLGYNAADTLVNNNKPTTFVAYDVKSKTFTNAVSVNSPDPNAQWVAIVSNPGGTTYPAFVLELFNTKPNGYRFQVRSLSFNGQVSAPLATMPYDNTFVNYFWSEFDSSRQKLYVLSGDENSLFDLNVRLFVVDTRSGQVTYTDVDNSAYTITSIHVDPRTGQLYALSPGLYPQVTPQWSLVTVSASNGKVSLVGNLSSPLLGDYYGGGVYGTGITNTRTVLHQFKKSTTGSTILGFIDMASGAMQSSTTLDTGVNNAISLNTVVYLPSQ